jgi:hypothetical protein
MNDPVFPLSGDTFCIDVDISGVSLTLRHGPRLFPGVLSDDLIDLWVEKVQIELAAVAPEMKVALRKLKEEPLFGDDDA